MKINILFSEEMIEAGVEEYLSFCALDDLPYTDPRFIVIEVLKAIISHGSDNKIIYDIEDNKC